MQLLRTPDERFADLPAWPHEPRYVDVDGVRIGYVDVGPSDADPVLCLHGEPTWGFLWRKVVPPLATAGHRVVVPDLVGFGRSDKPTRVEDHTYQRHVDWVRGFLDAVQLDRIVLVCQDWGGLLGLRVAAEEPDRFTGICAANTGLPTGDQRMPPEWHAFKDAVVAASELDVARFVRSGCLEPLTPEAAAAYDAPFPDESYKAGPRALPQILPIRPDDPATEANRAALLALSRWHKPFLTAFSDGDPITRGVDRIMQAGIPGAQGMPHTTIAGAGHFLQEDRGEKLAQAVLTLLGRMAA